MVESFPLGSPISQWGRLKIILAFLIRDANIAKSYPFALFLKIVTTIASVALLYLPAQIIGDQAIFSAHGGFLPFSIIGMSLMSFFMTNYSGFATAIRTEQHTGTIEAVLMTPVQIPMLLLGCNAWNLVMATLIFALTVGTGAIFYDIELHGNFFAAIFFMLLTGLCFACLGVMSASFIVVFKRGDPFRIIISAGFFLLGGVVYPITLFPEWLQTIAKFLPITHGASALRSILLHNTPLHQLYHEALLLFIYDLVALPLSLFCFAWAINQAKRDGSLLHY